MVRQLYVAVVVDSSSCLPPELLRQWNITVVPHELIIGNRSYRDGVDIHPEEFYRLLKDNQHPFTTAAPRPQQFLEAFLAAGELAPEVLCITLSTKLSATYRSACAAVELANGRLADIKVRVVDSRAAAGASGLIALAAARWAGAGDTADQVVSKVNRLIPRVNLIAFLETLAYLGRSGRLRRFEVWAGSLLSIKPLTELRLGEARILEKPRSRAKATERLLDIMHQRVGPRPVWVNVMEAAAANDALALSIRIQADFNCRELFISQFTPVMGLHTGPGLLGTAFYMEEDVDPPSSARP